MKFITVLFFLIVLTQLTAQSSTSQLSGKVTSKENTPYPEIKVVVYENDLAIDSTYTDSSGNYTFVLDLKPRTEYSASMQINKFHIDPKDIFRKASDTILNVEYFLDVQLGNYLYDKFDNSAYFEFNVVDSFSNVEIEWFKSLLEEYPNICLKLYQTTHSDESLNIANARIKFFENLLIETGCDMNRIQFSTNIRTLEEYELIEDKRARILGEVVSNNGECE